MKRNEIVEFATDPTKNFLTSFVIGVLLFTIVSDGVSFLFWEVMGEWLQARTGMEKGWLRSGIVTVLILLLLLIIYGTNFSRWFRGWLAKMPFLGVQTPAKAVDEPLNQFMPGLIVVMGKQDPNSAAEVAIRHHWNNGQSPHLKHCWIICTQDSLPFATAMVKRFTEEGVDQSVKFYYGNYSIADIEQPGQEMNLLVPNDLLDNPGYIRKLVNCLYADAETKGMEESEMIADYTGGPKGTTAGILLACAVPERKLQYISQVQSPSMRAINISYKVRPARG